LTVEDTGKYFLKVTLEDKYYSQTLKKTEKTLNIDIKVAEAIVEEAEEADKNDTLSENNSTLTEEEKD